MANNNPMTYDCRVAFKECFSALSDCKRVAMKELPTDFFIYFFKNIVTTIKTNPDYRDIVFQAQEARRLQFSLCPAGIQFVDATMEVFEDTVKELCLEISPNPARVYREFLTNKEYIKYYVSRVALIFNS